MGDPGEGLSAVVTRGALGVVLLGLGAFGCALPPKDAAVPVGPGPSPGEGPAVLARDQGDSVTAPPADEALPLVTEPPPPPPPTEASPRAAPPADKLSTAAVGRLPPEQIQRIVRGNFAALRACYELGLKRDPALRGRVNVRFVIGREGRVSQVSDSGSEMPDREVLRCVLEGFEGLEFPRPEGGIVTVVYPILFSPAE